MEVQNLEVDNEAFLTEKSVCAAFDQELAAIESISDLKMKDFATSEISILHFGVDPSKDFELKEKSKTADGAALGGAIGMAGGGALGWLAGAGSLSVPGGGILIAAGPIMAMLATAGGAGVITGIAGALIGLGFSEYQANNLEKRLKNGTILVSVTAETKHEQKIASDVFKQHNASDIFLRYPEGSSAGSA
ncbi:MAG: hypothetical protein KDD42_07045 [Bdellovibrionales bacterium]|nr:hypothetical protein [Bdellovibrionales bacterium]